MTTTHRIGTTAVLILSLAAAGAPAASAASYSRQDKSMVPAANGQSSTAARPNPDEQTVTAATANRTSAPVYSRQDKSMVPTTTTSSTAGSTANLSTPPPVVHAQTPANGFDWGDAGIGLAGGLALAMIGLGGALAISQHRTRRTRNTTA